MATLINAILNRDDGSKSKLSLLLHGTTIDPERGLWPPGPKTLSNYTFTLRAGKYYTGDIEIPPQAYAFLDRNTRHATFEGERAISIPGQFVRPYDPHQIWYVILNLNPHAASDKPIRDILTKYKASQVLSNTWEVNTQNLPEHSLLAYHWPSDLFDDLRNTLYSLPHNRRRFTDELMVIHPEGSSRIGATDSRFFSPADYGQEDL